MAETRTTPPAGIPPLAVAPDRVLELASTWQGEPVPYGERVSVLLRASDGGLTIEVAAPFHGDPPPPGPPGPCEGLWEHEVVEVFLAGWAPASRPIPYTEVELSPHGHYLVLRLEGARRVIERGLPLAFRAHRQGGRWVGEALLPLALLPPAPLRVNAFAIHGRGAGRRFLAWEPVPGSQPDFHRPDRFSLLNLPLPAAAPRNTPS
jgi:hypothetical protein